MDVKTESAVKSEAVSFPFLQVSSFSLSYNNLRLQNFPNGMPNAAQLSRNFYENSQSQKPGELGKWSSSSLSLPSRPPPPEICSPPASVNSHFFSSSLTKFARLKEVR